MTTAELERYNPLPRAIRVPLHPAAPRLRATPGNTARDVLARVLDVDPRRVVVTSSGTAALRLALRGLGVDGGSGGEVVVPTFACGQVVQAVLDEGLRPVLADVGDDLCLTVSSVARATTRRTRAVVAVRAFGVAPDVLGHCREAGLAVVDDAAQSLPTVRTGAASTVLSFGPQKPVPAGVGGALVLGEGATVASHVPVGDWRSTRVRDAAVRGVRRVWARGPAAVRLAPALLDRVPDAIERADYSRACTLLPRAADPVVARALAATSSVATEERALVHARFADALSGSTTTRLHARSAQHLRHGYCVLLTDDRPRVAAELAAAGVETSWLYYPLHRTSRYGRWASAGPWPAYADDVWRRTLLVPCRPGLTARQLDRVATALRRLP